MKANIKVNREEVRKKKSTNKLQKARVKRIKKI